MPRRSFVVALCCWLVACASAPPPPAGGAADLRVRANWLRENEMVAAEIFGSGVGVWNDQVAFRVSDDELRGLQRAIEQAGFASMPPMIGNTKKTKNIRGKVTVSSGRAGKTVVQLLVGEQSEALAGLAAEVITIARNAARGGTRAESLDDGLRKLERGELPAEALRVSVQRRDDRPQPQERGWLLRIRGREATVREIDARSGYGSPRRIVLTDEELRRLVTLLAGSDAASLPANLYAPMYTDFRVDVLDQSRDLQARRYADVTPETHGARQRAFDAAFDALRGIAARASETGEVIPVIEP